MKINCIIIEDEPLALERVKGYVEKIPFLHLMNEFDNAIDAITYLKENTVDLIFLDINMDDFSGIQFLESTTLTSQVIITTAYDQYAIKSYDFDVTDYLLKPFTFDRFIQAMDKVTLKRSEQTKTDHFFVKTENRLERIEFSKIIYIEGMRDYRRIHCLDKRIMTLQTFTELEKILPSSSICRVHKSYMVALDKIDSIQRNRIYIGEEIIPVSDSYQKAFFERINR